MVSVVKWFKTSGCDSDMRGFESHQTPQSKIVDKAQSSVDVGEVSYLKITVVYVVDNNTTYPCVTK